MDFYNESGILARRYGQGMDDEQFYKFLFREHIQDIKACGFVGNEMIDYKSVPFRTPKQAKELAIAQTHFSIGLYFREISRLKENLRYMVAIPVDIDWAKRDIKRTKSQVWQIIKERTGIEISALWDSKTKWCYHGVIRITMMVGTPKSIHLLEWISKEIANAINSDVAAVNSNQWLRIGSRNGRFEKYSDVIYNVDKLKVFLPTKEELEDRRNKFDNTVSLSAKRMQNHPAIKALLDGNIISWRNNACFTAALLLKVMDYSQDEASNHLLSDWFEKVNQGIFTKPFTEKEAKKAIKSAYTGGYRGPSKEWIRSVTGIEYQYNLSYVRTKYNNANEVRIAIIDYLRKNPEVTLKQEELAAKINMPLRSVKRNLKQLKDENAIDYKAQRGRYSQGTSFKLLKENPFSKNEIIAELDIGYNELEEYNLI